MACGAGGVEIVGCTTCSKVGLSRPDGHTRGASHLIAGGVEVDDVFHLLTEDVSVHEQKVDGLGPLGCNLRGSRRRWWVVGGRW